jgi:mannose-6-phosphate isomerase-like protein (cupin superfamily)
MKPWSLVLPIALAALAASPLRAQTPATGPEHIGHAQLQAAVTPAADAPPRAMVAKLLGNRGHYSYIALRRTGNGEPEVHEGWDDVMVVQEGGGTLLLGGEVQGGRVTAPGEIRGGEIRGGQRQPLAAGDMMIVPAGVPHQVLLAAGESITYLVLKVQRPASTQPR